MQTGAQCAQAERKQQQQHRRRAQKAQNVCQIRKNKIVPGVGHKDVLPGEQPLPRQPAGANGHGPLVLLVGNVRQRGVIGSEHGQDALELVALQNAGPQCQQRRAADHTRRQAARHQPVGQPARVEHDQPDAQKHQRRAVVTLHMNGRRRQRNVQKKQQQIFGAVHLPAHPAQMQRQRQNKADFCQLGGLEGHAAHPVPAVVGRAARVIANRDQAGVDVVQKQRRQHQPPRHNTVQRPRPGQRMVIRRGKDGGQHQPQQTGDELHRRLVVAAKLRLPDGQQHHDADCRARRTEQQIDHIDPAQIPADERIHGQAPFLIDAFIIAHFDEFCQVTD